ncbi:hypothetical protein FRC19_005724 [Serendipita sp. 401]|nr:hypothetical protein FRC19_005724 [Serendipita sp. 401]KAG9023090.1 hypothetical protein FS842_005844 [Serendipita sp. 407]
MQGTNDPDNQSRPVRDVKSQYSSASMAVAAASAPKTPLPKLKEGFPLVIPEVLKKTCDAIHDYGLMIIKESLKEDSKMPDERHLTGDLIFRLRTVGKLVTGQHTQVEEGKTGTDVYIKVSFAEEQLPITGGMASVGISDHPTTSGAAHTETETKPRANHIIAIQAKSAKPIDQAALESDEEPEPEEETKTAKPDPLHPEDTKREIDFTYKGKGTTQLQMYLLRGYVENLHKEHVQDASIAIIGGYLIYTHEGYIWLPVEDVIKKCEEITRAKCKKSRKTNRQLTHFFLSQEKHWETPSPPGSPVLGGPRAPAQSVPPQKSLKCFLEEMRNTPKFVPS